MARPTKYSADIQKQAEEYLENYDQHGDVVPSIVGLARVINIHRDTIHEWRKEHSAFSDTLEDLEQEQERVLTSKGLTGDFNSNITKLMLHNHGFSDKKELSGPNGGPIPVENTWNLQPVSCGSDSSQGS